MIHQGYLKPATFVTTCAHIGEGNKVGTGKYSNIFPRFCVHILSGIERGFEIFI